MIEKFIEPRNVRLELKAKDKTAVLEELVDVLVDSGSVVDKKKVLTAVLAREKLCSTGFEQGVAIPHPRQGDSTAIKKLVAAIGISKEGIDFDSLDGSPVKIFILLCAPNDQEHLRALARLARLLKDDNVREGILKAKTAEEIVDWLIEQEKIILKI